MAATGVDTKLREQQQVIEAQRSKVGSELKGLAQQQQQYILKAPFTGSLYLTNPDLAVGDWVGKSEKLGELVAHGGLRVETYLAEADIHRLSVGNAGMFYPEAGSPAALKLIVENIDTDATHELTDGMLASTRGGAVPVREHARTLVPEHALYRVVLSVQDKTADHHLPVLRGQVVIHGEAQSWLAGYLRAVLAVVWREAGF